MSILECVKIDILKQFLLIAKIHPFWFHFWTLAQKRFFSGVFQQKKIKKRTPQRPLFGFSQTDPNSGPGLIWGGGGTGGIRLNKFPARGHPEHIHINRLGLKLMLKMPNTPWNSGWSLQSASNRHGTCLDRCRGPPQFPGRGDGTALSTQEPFQIASSHGQIGYTTQHANGKLHICIIYTNAILL